jgi:hypothetical protein
MTELGKEQPKISIEKEQLKISRDIDVFRKYIEQRKEESEKDLELLSQNFNIEIQKLEDIRNEIRNIIGNNVKYISTTIHFRVRVIDFLKLGSQRIKKATQNNVLHYPVYYQKFSQERPDIIDIGEIKISLIDLIPEFKKLKFHYSIEFHEALLGYLNKDNWEEEIKQNLNDYLNKKLSNINKESRKLFIDHLIPIIIILLKDYEIFFKNFQFNKKEDIMDLNSKICEVLLNNFETLKTLFEKLDITKEYLEDLKEKKNLILDSKIIFLISILGGFIHIGAEYGKLNDIRKSLNLPEIIETEVPQERFNLFGVRNIESGTLRFLFGDSWPFIYSGIYSGLEETLFSPISPEVKNKIRVVDFYYKLKDINIDEIWQTTYLNKEDFRHVLDSVDYFSHLNDDEKQKAEEIFKNLPETKKNLTEWIEEFNNKIILEVGKRGKIFEQVLKSKLLLLIFKEYVKSLLFNLNLPDSLNKRIIDEFCSKKILENMENRSKDMFGGLLPKLNIPSFNQNDMINLGFLFEIENKNFNFNLHSLFNKIEI